MNKMLNEDQIEQMTLDIFRELGSGGMFVSSEDFVAEHSGRIDDIAIYGQELNTTTWRLAKMNMAIRGIDADIRQGDTYRDDELCVSNISIFTNLTRNNYVYI
jgi:type I restriction-modification system DNA methylase subunit